MKKLLLVTAAAGMLALPALAADKHEGHGPRPSVTRADLQKNLGEHFARLDTNKDGAITKAEFDASREAAKQEWAKKRAERQDERFAALDTDKNGQVSKAEFDAHHAAMAGKRAEWHKERAEDGKPERGHFGHHRGQMAHRGGKAGGDLFAYADANKDGKVTLAEFSAKPLERFDAADANKDGTITPEERRAAWDKMRAEWKQDRAAPQPAPKS